jgi:DNA invertase Pin-like site-specific DNA recombinase
MTGVIYARYSSDNQREESIEGQLRECAAFARKNDIHVIGNYIDRAFSAKTDNRPEFQRMIRESARKAYDVVIVWKLDRFSRNRYDSAKYKAALKKNNVRVVSATEAISDGAEGIILESVLEGMAEYYSADLAEKVTRGHTENALKCRFNGSIVPYGYVIDKEKHYQLDAEKAPIVLEIFKRYSSGESIVCIINDLNERGLRTAKGNKFNKNSLRHMLKNRNYIGEYHYNGMVTPGGVPAIVPDNIFNRANELIETNKRTPARKKAKEDYLLTTKLFCGHCNAMMVGESGQKRNGNIYRYYKCAGAKKHVCDKKSVRKEWMEEVALKLIMQTLMDEEMLQKIADLIMELQKAENTVIPALERQLAEVQASIENIVKAIEMGVFTRSTKMRLEELEAEEERIKGDICREQLDSRLVTKDQIWYIFDKFRNMDLSMPQQRQKIIDSFLHSIVLYDDRLVISFNYREKEKTLKLDQLVEFIHSNGSDLGSAASPPKSTANAVLFLFFAYLNLAQTDVTKE